MSIKKQLTNTQLQFVEHHKIPEDLLINASGIRTTAELLQIMTNQGKAIAFNTSSCEKNNTHTFKTNGGHCPQCRTANIQFALAEYKTAFIYIVGSKKSRLLKVGQASDIEKRERSLNSLNSKYADCNDWKMVFYAKTINCGKVERMIHEKLSRYQDTQQYQKTDGLHDGRELFRCSYNTAKKAIEELKTENKIDFLMEREQRSIIEEYRFPNLLNPVLNFQI